MFQSNEKIPLEGEYIQAFKVCVCACMGYRERENPLRRTCIEPTKNCLAKAFSLIL